MTAAFRSVSSRAVGVSTISPALPSGWQPNDILVCFIETENQTGTSGLTPTSGSPSTLTWQPVAVFQGTGTAGSAGACGLQAFWKRAESSEGTVTVPDSGVYTVAYIAAYSGADTTSPIDGPVGGVEATSDTSGSATQITTSQANELVIVASANAVDTTATQFSAYTNGNLSGLAMRASGNWSTQNGGGLYVADGTKAVAGATGATTWTQASASYKAFLTFGLKSAAVVDQGVAQFGASGSLNAGASKVDVGAVSFTVTASLSADATVTPSVVSSTISIDTIAVGIEYTPATIQAGTAEFDATGSFSAGASQAAIATATFAATGSLSAVGSQQGTTSVQATEATGTATAYDATISSSSSVTPGTATGSGVAYDATTSGVAQSSTISIDTIAVQIEYTPPSTASSVSAGSAEATADAPFEAGVSVSLDLIADDAIHATAVAYDATISVQSASFVYPTTAEATAAAYNASTSGTGIVTGSANFAATASLAAGPLVTKVGQGTFAATASLLATPSGQGAAMFSASSTLSAGASQTEIAGATFSVTGSLACAPSVEKSGATTFSATGSLAVGAPQFVRTGVATPAAVASLVAGAAITEAALTVFGVTGSFAVVPTIAGTGPTATLTSTGSLLAGSFIGWFANATFGAIGSFAAAGVTTEVVTATFASTASLSAIGGQVWQKAATFSATGSLVAGSSVDRVAVAVFSGTGSLTAGASLAISASGVSSVTVALIAGSTSVAFKAALFEAQGSLAAVPYVTSTLLATQDLNVAVRILNRIDAAVCILDRTDAAPRVLARVDALARRLA